MCTAERHVCVCLGLTAHIGDISCGNLGLTARCAHGQSHLPQAAWDTHDQGPGWGK